MYFKDFPRFYYDFKQNDGSTKSSIVTDITRNIRFRRDILSNVTLYDLYDIQDGDTPEIIAEKVYGNPQYHWVIMLLNEKFDYISDFPLDEPSLVKFIDAKYNTIEIKRTDNSAISNVVLHMAIGGTGGGLTAQQVNLLNYLADGTTAGPPRYPNSIADLDQSGGVTSTDSRRWLLAVNQSITDPAVETALAEILATERANPGTYPSDIFIAQKYAPKHYVDDNGYIVDRTASGAVSVSYEEYERQVNESKRTIKLVSPDVLSNILKNYKDLL